MRAAATRDRSHVQSAKNIHKHWGFYRWVGHTDQRVRSLPPIAISENGGGRSAR